MKHVSHLIFQAVVLSALTMSANAAEPDAIFGRWIEKFPNGNGLVTEFSASQMVSYGVDYFGRRGRNVGQYYVTYKNLGPSTVSVEFQGGGGVMLAIKDSKTIMMDLPGMGAHLLKRMEDY